MMSGFTETLVLPRVLCTAIGSVPHSDADQAVDLILSTLSVAAHAPSLSRADLREQMWIQFTENLPRFRTDLENLKYHFDTSGDPTSEIEAFYSQFLAVEEGGDAAYFAVGPEYGRGIHTLLGRLEREKVRRPFLKVQVTGPLSFGLTVTDEQGKPIFYHPMFRDVAVKGMGLKAVRLLEVFSPFADKVIVFFDEPSLSAYGSSAMLGLSKSDVVEVLDEVMNMVLERGGIPGVHCCGNTDWGLLMETGTRIINFDGVDYMESLAIYARELSRFLERGGVLAWGVVRNTERVMEDSALDVAARLRSGLDLLEKNGVNRAALAQRLILTPACGCAGLKVNETEKVYALLAELESMPPEDLLGP